MAEELIAAALIRIGDAGLSRGELRAACKEVDGDAFAKSLRTMQADKRVLSYPYEDDVYFYMAPVVAANGRHCASCVCDMADPDASDMALARAKRTVMRVLAEHGPMTVSQVGQRGFNGRSRKWCAPALARLAEQGRVQVTPEGAVSIGSGQV